MPAPPLAVGPDEPAYGAYLNALHFGEATLTFPQTIVLRYGSARAAGEAVAAGGRRLRALDAGAHARVRDADGEGGLRRRAGRFTVGRHFGRLCAMMLEGAIGFYDEAPASLASSYFAVGSRLAAAFQRAKGRKRGGDERGAPAAPHEELRSA